MKLTFVTLMLHALNFGSNSVERSRSAVAMGIQSSDFVRQIAIEAFPNDLLRIGRTKCKLNGRDTPQNLLTSPELGFSIAVAEQPIMSDFDKVVR